MPVLLARILPALAAPAAALMLSAMALPAVAQGVSGPYLAAEHAARRGDIQEAARYFAQALSKDPENVSLLERAVLHQVAAGRIGTAVGLARQLQENNPADHLGVLVLAADGLRRGDAAGVRAMLEQAETQDLPFVAQVILAWTAHGAGDTEGARAALRKMEEDEVGGPAGKLMAAYHLGLIEAAAGNDEAAAEAFQRSSELAGSPQLRQARFHAAALARLGRTEEALAVVRDRLSKTFGNPRLEQLASDIEAGREVGPELTRASQGAAEALFGISGFLSRGPTSSIPIAYSRLATWMDPDFVEAKLLIAEMLAEGEQYELAIEAYAEVPVDAPEALDAMIGRARALEESDRLSSALDMLREVVVRFPTTIEAHIALGDALRRGERFAEAADAYDASLALIDTDEERFWALYYQRGIAYERSDQWDKAEADFRKALELKPDQPLVLNYLGYSFVELGRNLDEAEAMIEKAVEQRPEDGFIIDSLGWVQFRLGKFGEAVDNLEHAVELMPVDPILNDHYGDALWMVGRRTEARFQWKRAMSFEPEPEDATRIRRKLKVGLDEVLAEEAAEGRPTIITGTDAATAPDGG